jgi:hypothetical protein
MTKPVQGSITLAPVDVGSLPGTVDHYQVVATEAGGATVSASAPIDATTVSFALDIGTWVVTVSAVDASNNVVTGPVTGLPNPLVITETVMVNVPVGLALSVG